jgi:hypothetical protein
MRFLSMLSAKTLTALTRRALVMWVVWPSADAGRSGRTQLLFRGDYGVDELIDTIEGNRKYIRCIYAYNKYASSRAFAVSYAA